MVNDPPHSYTLMAGWLSDRMGRAPRDKTVWLSPTAPNVCVDGRRPAAHGYGAPGCKEPQPRRAVCEGSGQADGAHTVFHVHPGTPHDRGTVAAVRCNVGLRTCGMAACSQSPVFGAHLCGLVSCLLGMFHRNWWYTFLLYTLAAYIGGVQRVVSTILSNMHRLASVVLALLLLFLLFSAIALTEFPESFSFPDLPSSCDTLWACTLMNIDYGFREAPYWGDR